MKKKGSWQKGRRGDNKDKKGDRTSPSYGYDEPGKFASSWKGSKEKGGLNEAVVQKISRIFRQSPNLKTVPNWGERNLLGKRRSERKIYSSGRLEIGKRRVDESWSLDEKNAYDEFCNNRRDIGPRARDKREYGRKKY